MLAAMKYFTKAKMQNKVNIAGTFVITTRHHKVEIIIDQLVQLHIYSKGVWEDCRLGATRRKNYIKHHDSFSITELYCWHL